MNTVNRNRITPILRDINNLYAATIESENRRSILNRIERIHNELAALTQPEQRTSARDIARAVGMPIQPEQPEAGREDAERYLDSWERYLKSRDFDPKEREAERDQLRARVVTLEIEREAQRSCAIYWMDQENTLRASIVALAERLEGVNESWAEYIVGELRQLGESNSAAAQEGL